jgi:hypothetical protein
MEDIKQYFIVVLFFFLAGCAKPPRNYYPDSDDPGLSRLTSYGYNIATNYINGVAYINPYNEPAYFSLGPLPPAGNVIPTFNKIIGSGQEDTLALAWPIEINDGYQNINYLYISILMPVPKNFTENNFAALSGERLDSNTNIISLSQNSAASYYTYNTYPVFSDSLAYTSPRGPSNIYFVTISLSSSGGISMAGLFNGNIGDTAITDGRFDFYLPSNYINFSAN